MTRSIEFLRPSQIRTELVERSLVYVPLGTIEWHCEHLPVGLDGLTAHGICLRAADMSKGLVWPTLYYGTGGDHGQYPWTIMMDTGDELEELLRKALTRLADLGVERVVLFSGHFADDQLDLIDKLAAELSGEKNMSVVATAVNRFDVPGFPPDHAGRFETTLLAGLHPNTIDLGSLAPANPGDEVKSRHDPSHTLWGVIGADPRISQLTEGPDLVDNIATKLATLATDRT
jgi:creatinine amidohydrolase